MSTIQELIEQRVANLEALAAQPAPDSTPDAVLYAASVAENLHWTCVLLEYPSERRASPLTEQEQFAIQPNSTGKELHEIWDLPGIWIIHGAEELTPAIVQSLQAINARIEKNIQEGLTSSAHDKSFSQVLCAYGLNFAAAVIEFAAEDPEKFSINKLMMQALTFCRIGMQPDTPSKNLFFLSKLDQSFVNAAKFFVPPLQFNWMIVGSYKDGEAVIVSDESEWEIDEQVAAELDPQLLGRSESFLRAASGALEHGLTLVDLAIRPECEKRIRALNDGANALRAIVLGRPITGRDDPNTGRGR